MESEASEVQSSLVTSSLILEAIPAEMLVFLLFGAGDMGEGFCKKHNKIEK